jgi:hypothetical protein
MTGRVGWRHWKALFYFLLILAMLLLAPEAEVKFIYTEF